ncbi:MAG: IclR family transcriptional regulator [Hyphomicrobiales bacterium]|nr:IclR family transcriptional regulator [Hyphomicrobiales bacterium]
MGSKSGVRSDGKDSLGRSRQGASQNRARASRAIDREIAADEAPAGAGSILKALRILEQIVDGARPISVAELSTILNYSKPTTHRIATFLEEFGYLEREPGGRRFVESQRLVDLALKILLAAAQRPNRRGILNWVVEKTGETCNFGIMHRGELVYLDRVQSDWPLGLRFESGSRVPLHCTAIGKLFLSMLPGDALDSLLKTIRLTKYTDTTIVDEKKLRASLAEIRKSGISIDDQEFMYGVVCIAVPVFDPSGEMRAGLAISAPEARMSSELAFEHAPVLRAAAAKMQAAMFTPAGQATDNTAENADDLLRMG